MTRRFAFSAVGVFLIGLFMAGCGGPTDQTSAEGGTSSGGSDSVGETQHAHDPHDVPLTDEQIQALEDGLADYADACTKIRLYRDKIRDEIAAGEPAHAHRPLDELDVILDKMPEVARDNKVPKSDWEAVNTNAQALRDAFNKVHAQIDAGEEPDYESVSDDIDKALTVLEGIKPAATDNSSDSNKSTVDGTQ